MNSQERRAAPGALVLGSDFFTAGVVESLGSQGVPVALFGRKTSPARYSKYKQLFLEDPGFSIDNDPQGLSLAETLLDLGGEHNMEGYVVYPTSDMQLESLAKQYDLLSGMYNLACPTPEQTEIALNKRRTYQVAESLGIPVPETAYPSGEEALDELKIKYPAVIKPAVGHHFHPNSGKKMLGVDNLHELKAAYKIANEFIPPEEIMIQELIPGKAQEQFSYAAVYDNGSPKGWLVARKMRQFPEFGLACHVETVENDKVRELGDKFLGGIKYTGMAEIEFQRDPEGIFKILDANLRAWGWHTLGKKAGIDFSHILWKVKSGEPVNQLKYKVGVSWIREAEYVFALKQSGKGFINSAREFLGILGRPLQLATLTPEDIVPSMIEVSSKLSRAAKSLHVAKV